MKLVGILIGILTGSITGSVIGIFSGNYINDILIAGFLSGLITLIFFKNEKQNHCYEDFKIMLTLIYY